MVDLIFAALITINVPIEQQANISEFYVQTFEFTDGLIDDFVVFYDGKACAIELEKVYPDGHYVTCVYPKDHNGETIGPQTSCTFH